jgi:23S rRNA (pseudouridine1915-N3)-methyltransferase
MQILIAAIGKIKSGPELALYDYYTQRIPWKITLKEYEIKKPLASQARKEKETELLLAGVQDSEHIVALDEGGGQMTSAALARHLRKIRDDGARRIAFIIGGADGLHESVLKRAQLSLSFGSLTWPHMLMRALLAEQLYRAHTIISGHPYHRA